MSPRNSAFFFSIALAAVLTFQTRQSPARGACEKSGNDTGYRIVYIGQYPAEEGYRRNGFFRELKNLVMGEEMYPGLRKPVNIVAFHTDSLYILDQDQGLVWEVRKGKGSIPSFVKKKMTGLPSLVGICRFEGRKMLITDSRMNQIYLLDPENKEFATFPVETELKQPTGIAWSPATGDIWVTETAEHRITVFDSRGKRVRTIGQRGTRAGEFNFPTHLWIDRSGNACIVDAMNFRIQLFDSQGNYSGSFGEAGDATGYLNRPKGVATDSRGNIYVTDALFHNIQVFDRQGTLLYRFGQQGRGREEFWMPAGICIDDQDYIYVTDSFNARVQIFRLQGPSG